MAYCKGVWGPQLCFYCPPSPQGAYPPQARDLWEERSDVCVQRGGRGSVGWGPWRRGLRGRGWGARADALGLHVGHKLVRDLSQHIAGQARHA